MNDNIPISNHKSVSGLLWYNSKDSNDGDNRQEDTETI